MNDLFHLDKYFSLINANGRYVASLASPSHHASHALNVTLRFLSKCFQFESSSSGRLKQTYFIMESFYEKAPVLLNIGGVLFCLTILQVQFDSWTLQWDSN